MSVIVGFLGMLFEVLKLWLCSVFCLSMLSRLWFIKVMLMCWVLWVLDLGRMRFVLLSVKVVILLRWWLCFLKLR